MTPINRTDRVLLASVHRRAREHGWRRGRYGWQNGDDATATMLVAWHRNDPYPLGLSWAVNRFGDGSPCWSIGSRIRVESVTQAVDVLVALVGLPAWLSSAYALAEDKYAEVIEALEEELARKDRYLAMGDRTIAGLMEENRELRAAAGHRALSQPFPPVTIGGERQ